MKYYIIAGEPSGDLHASNCMKEILNLDSEATFKFTGGDLMEKVSNIKATVHISKMAFMGFIDVLKNILTIQENFKKVKQDILNFNPDLIILVDYPGFNLRMAKWATQKGFKVNYYISPTVWAWKTGRVEEIKKYTNKLFVILPFEEAFYKTYNHQVYFVGHPLLDAIEQQKPSFKSKEQFLGENKLLHKPIVAVLPGSRVQEINRMLKNMIEVVEKFPTFQFVFAGTSNLPKSSYETLAEHSISVVFNQTYELMNYATAGIIKSGTSTLESALFDLPQVVCYKTGGLSFAIGKQLVKLKFISLVNLIANKEVVKELVQSDFTTKNISEELNNLLHSEKYRETILEEYQKIKMQLGGIGASMRLAQYCVNDASSKN
jgi:lipid-A-disaccharide synthase